MRAFMDKSALDLFFDAQKLHTIERWTRRFASLMLLNIILVVLSFLAAIYNMYNMYVNLPWAVGPDVNEKLWLKSNTVLDGLILFFTFTALYLLLQGLSKIIRYILNLKTLAYNRYHARKIAS